jgi:hypothetical protein
MSMEGAFDRLLNDLDDDALIGLGRALALETSQRRQTPVFQVEDIHPRMSATDKERAMREIIRVLRGEE